MWHIVDAMAVLQSLNKAVGTFGEAAAQVFGISASNLQEADLRVEFIVERCPESSMKMCY